MNSSKQRRYKVILFCARNLINFLAYRTKYINYIWSLVTSRETPYTRVLFTLWYRESLNGSKRKREREKRGIPFEEYIQTRVICVAKCVGGVRHARYKELRSTCALMNHDSPLIIYHLFQLQSWFVVESKNLGWIVRWGDEFSRWFNRMMR